MFEITKALDISILHLYGEISLLEMEFIQKQLESLRRFQHTKILLDLAQVDHVHFQAVRRWAEHAAQLQQEEAGDLRLAHVNQQTKHMIQFVGADQTLKDYATTADAILSFLQPPKAFQYGLGEPVRAGVNGKRRPVPDEAGSH